MWINSPLGQWEMKTRSQRAPRDEELRRWLREDQGPRKTQGRWKSAALGLGLILILSVLILSGCEDTDERIMRGTIARLATPSWRWM